jgi:A/G-specific adenine glycosylase
MICVFNNSCAALAKKESRILPVKLKKVKVTNRFFNYLVLEDVLGNTLIQKRTAKGIWHNLYEFPLLETDEIVGFDSDFKSRSFDVFPSYTIIGIEECNETTVIHKLSHQHLHIQFWKVKIAEKIENGLNAIELKTFPFPIVIYNFIEKQEIEI